MYIYIYYVIVGTYNYLQLTYLKLKLFYARVEHVWINSRENSFYNLWNVSSKDEFGLVANDKYTYNFQII